jgi:cytochrome c-type biogenesis protein CcmH
MNAVRGRWRAAPVAWLLAALLLLPGVVAAQAVRDASPLQFQDAAEERRFNALVAELRCVMCQNQSLADSNAQIAHDLRREVFDLMRGGRSDAEIRGFLVERYGEFVLYRPRFGGHTALLWLAPGLLLVVGGVVVARIVRARGRRPLPVEEEQEW